MHRIVTSLIVATSLLASGCASDLVTSIPVNGGTKAAGKSLHSYARYALQRTILTIDIDDATTGASGPAAATTGAAATGSATPAAAAPSVPVTITNTVTSGAAPAAAAPAAAAKADASKAEAATPATLPALCSDLRKAYDQKRLQLISYKVRQQVLLDEIDAWTKPDGTVDADTVTKEVTAYADTKTAGLAALATAQASYPTIKDYCPPSYKVTIAQKDETDPDPNKSFFLAVTPNDFYDDQLSVQTGGDGTLVSVGYTSVDRTTDIITNAAKSIATIAVTAFGAPPGLPVKVADFDRCSPKIGKGAGDWPALLKAKPTVVQLQELRTCVVQDRDTTPTIPDIDIAHYERTIVARGKRDFELPRGLQLHLRCPDTAVKTETIDGATAIAAQDRVGVYVSTPQPCIVAIGLPVVPPDPAVPAAGPLNAPVTVKDTYAEDLGVAKNEMILNRTAFAALDSDTAMLLPLRRTSFTTRTATYSFTAGRLTTATYNRPSPFVNAALLPATVIGAVVGTVTGQIKSRTDNLAAKTSYKSAQTDALNAQVKLDAAELAASKAAAAGGPTTP